MEGIGPIAIAKVVVAVGRGIGTIAKCWVAKSVGLPGKLGCQEGRVAVPFRNLHVSRRYWRRLNGREVRLGYS